MASHRAARRVCSTLRSSGKRFYMANEVLKVSPLRQARSISVLNKRLRNHRTISVPILVSSQRHYSIERQNSKTYEEALGDDLRMVLSSIGSSKEVQYWLNHYGNSGKREIAVVKIGGAILRDEEQMKTLVSSVSFLKKAGLSPVIIHGAGPQLIDALADQNIVSDYVEGLRVTTPQILRTARKVFLKPIVSYATH